MNQVLTSRFKYIIYHLAIHYQDSIFYEGEKLQHPNNGLVEESKNEIALVY